MSDKRGAFVIPYDGSGERCSGRVIVTKLKSKTEVGVKYVIYNVVDWLFIYGEIRGVQIGK